MKSLNEKLYSKEEANKILTELVNEAHASLKQCQEFADQHGLEFFFNHPDSAFSDSYKGKTLIQQRMSVYYDKTDDDWQKSLENDYPNGAWQSSSINC
jgi:hypothetical protein